MDYKWYDRLIPVVKPEIYHYDFEKFGVRWPTNPEFNSFGDKYRNTGFGLTLGFYYRDMGTFFYADLSALKRGDNAEKDLLENKILNDAQSLKLSKGNYVYHRSYGIDFTYQLNVANNVQTTPLLGWQSWKMISEVELIQTSNDSIVNSYSERNEIKNLIIGIKIKYFRLFGQRSKVIFDGKEYFTQKGIAIEPSYKKFLIKNLNVFGLEVGVGELFDKPLSGTILPAFYLSMEFYHGVVKSTVYKIGTYIRYDLAHIKLYK